MDQVGIELAALQQAYRKGICRAFHRLRGTMNQPDSANQPSAIKRFTDDITLIRQAYELAIIALGIPKDVQKLRRSPRSNRERG
jgi:hypothetical protein